MSYSNKYRIGTDIPMQLTLTDSGVNVNWNDVTVEKVAIMNMDQEAFAGLCSFSVNSQDPTKLDVVYDADQQVYLGDCRIVIIITAEGSQATYDAEGFCLVSSISEATGTPTSEDPAEVGITVENLPSSTITAILDACLQATADSVSQQSTVASAEQGRVTAEQARVNAEAARVLAEQARVNAEAERVNKEAARVTAEQNRVNAEAARVGAEQARVTAEQNRVNAEAARVLAEGGRVSAEADRVLAEQNRVNAEAARVGAEQARVTAEQNRVNAEAARVLAEQARVNAEQARVNAEAARVLAEQARADAETARQSGYSGFNTRITANESLLDNLKRDLGYNATSSIITLTAGQAGKYVKCATRSAEANAGFNISAPFNVDACSELLIKTGYNPSDNDHASLDISVVAIYEEMERVRTVQAEDGNGNPLYYEVDEDGNPTTTQTTVDTPYPVYTTETYTEYRYLPNNEDRFVAIPDSGYYIANIPQSCKCVISYKPGVSDLSVIVVKHGALANITSQIFGIYEHRTMGEAVTQLALRISALEAKADKMGSAQADKIDAFEYRSYLYPVLLRGAGAPAAAVIPDNLPDGLPWDGIPVFIGQMYMDTTNRKLYLAFGNSAVSDWAALN